MNIAVLGAGAMGSLFGALLAESGNRVSLLDVKVDDVGWINAHGLRVEREGRTRSVPVQATCDPLTMGDADLVIVFVKSTRTAEVAPTALRLAGDSGLVITLQNGLGNAEALARTVPARRVVAGTTAHGATLTGPGRIRHAGIGPTVIGMWAGGEKPQLDRIASVFTDAGIATQTATDIRRVIWDKLLVNVGINALTALTGILNGGILDLAATRDLCRDAVLEAAGVALALGVPVTTDPEHVLRVATATAANRSSMGQDVDKRRTTEISAINGAVVREADRLGLAVPVNRTLTALVETLQAHYPQRPETGKDRMP